MGTSNENLMEIIMAENKDEVKSNSSVADALIQYWKIKLIENGKALIDEISKYLKENIQNINWEKLFNRKTKDELLNIWSDQLAEQGFIEKGYAGLPEDLLIKNLHQEGYLDGMHVGYMLAMMSLVDNNAEKGLILSVRDDIRKNLIGHHYDNKAEFINIFKSEKYNWINSLSKKKIEENKR